VIMVRWFCTLTRLITTKKTHEIDAHGDVHIDPYRSQPQNTVIPR